ncbi:DUF1569 domain-containing protein [Chryseolinea soli]|uniref:DUF1569 domain-containing protein n=1 Tax=Chryseolinea soli TaxID=2321403 RepID=A0A385SMI7_9BACT|nr:DUF1569 domain-containing protein [Chryseolinea soli]AYB31497.1 DUF1569 domain-containing protein [Chryseolinea soli]
MKKSLLDKAAVTEIIGRVKNLNTESKGRWGKMTVTEMLLHCNLCNRRILEEDVRYIRPSARQRVIKFIVLYILAKIPKNNRGTPDNDTSGLIDVEYFNEQREFFMETLLRFPERKTPFRSLHPVMGYMRNEDWGIVSWMHMDHHLRQFGV